ncbi:hypothetical protein ACE6H2_011024 [Prunus campanulata]
MGQCNNIPYNTISPLLEAQEHTNGVLVKWSGLCKSHDNYGFLSTIWLSNALLPSLYSLFFLSNLVFFFFHIFYVNFVLCLYIYKTKFRQGLCLYFLMSLFSFVFCSLSVFLFSFILMIIV